MRKLDKNKLRNNLIGTSYIITAAFLWGSSFAVRKIGMECMGPLMLNVCRFIFAFLFLMAIVLVRKHHGMMPGIDKTELISQIKVGSLIGMFYALNVVFQQLGLKYVSAGETGFITSLYTIMVPILGWLVFKTKIRLINWIAIVLSGIGLYLVTNGGVSFRLGMIILLIGALCAAIQILLIAKYIAGCDPFILVNVQVFMGIAVNLILAVVMREPFEPAMVREAFWPILYTGLFSVGIANLFQFLGQRRVSPAVTVITCSFESVFGLLFGIILLGEVMTFMKACGCIIILMTVIMIQYEPQRKEDTRI